MRASKLPICICLFSGIFVFVGSLILLFHVQIIQNGINQVSVYVTVTRSDASSAH